MRERPIIWGRPLSEQDRMVARFCNFTSRKQKLGSHTTRVIIVSSLFSFSASISDVQMLFIEKIISFGAEIAAARVLTTDAESDNDG